VLDPCGTLCENVQSESSHSCKSRAWRADSSKTVLYLSMTRTANITANCVFKHHICQQI